jgi:hypothetical protein
LILNLLGRKLDREEMRQWYRWLDWLLDLRPEHAKALWQELGRLEKEKHVPFVTYAERYGMEKGLVKGRVEGLLAGLETALELKFGAPGLEPLPTLRQVDDPARLAGVLQALRQAASLDDLRKMLPGGDQPSS